MESILNKINFHFRCMGEDEGIRRQLMVAFLDPQRINLSFFSFDKRDETFERTLFRRIDNLKRAGE
jgi:hypothetical protein